MHVGIRPRAEAAFQDRVRLQRLLAFYLLCIALGERPAVHRRDPQQVVDLRQLDLGAVEGFRQQGREWLSVRDVSVAISVGIGTTRSPDRAEFQGTRRAPRLDELSQPLGCPDLHANGGAG